jgi:hypothetical protein
MKIGFILLLSVLGGSSFGQWMRNPGAGGFMFIILLGAFFWLDNYISRGGEK